MSDPRFKYTDATNSSVRRIWPDGRCESHLLQAETVQRWIAENGPPDAADPLSAEEIAAQQRLTIDRDELALAKADAMLLNLINMDPAQIAQAIDNAFLDPAQRVILRRMCRVLVPTARRVFR